MVLHAARVAPEKAVFRPALPMCSLPGISEMHMGTMTYREQLLHPNWQRKRLEILQRDRYECTNCGDAEKTLHVHHRLYIKGRMVWEYENDELTTLCADCHKTEHALREILNRITAHPELSIDGIVGLLAGYLDGICGIDQDMLDGVEHMDWYRYDQGILASMSGGASWEQMAAAARVVQNKFSPPQEAALDRWEGRI